MVVTHEVDELEEPFLKGINTRCKYTRSVVDSQDMRVTESVHFFFSDVWSNFNSSNLVVPLSDLTVMRDLGFVDWKKAFMANLAATLQVIVGSHYGEQ